jgi:hypothetical protein
MDIGTGGRGGCESPVRSPSSTSLYCCDWGEYSYLLDDKSFANVDGRRLLEAFLRGGSGCEGVAKQRKLNSVSKGWGKVAVKTAATHTKSARDGGFHKTRNLILERAAEPHVPKLQIWF